MSAAAFPHEGGMLPQVREALEASIKKWEQNTYVTNLNHAAIDAEDCPLCRLFNWHLDENEVERKDTCKGCPVYEKTGQTYCRGTPYDLALAAHEADNLYVFRKAAYAEVEFLESLR